MAIPAEWGDPLGPVFSLALEAKIVLLPSDPSPETQVSGWPPFAGAVLELIAYDHKANP